MINFKPWRIPFGGFQKIKLSQTYIKGRKLDEKRYKTNRSGLREEIKRFKVTKIPPAQWCHEDPILDSSCIGSGED